MSQTNNILHHLDKHGYVTPAIARAVYGIERLAARIYDVRKLGVHVVAMDRRDDRGHRYTEYAII